MLKETSKWKKLSRIDVSHAIEKKGGLSYVSWATAWSTLMEHYPDSTYYFGDITTFPDETVMVRAGVCVDGITHEQPLPVLDHRNKPIKNPSSMDINTAQQRALCKAAAMHGVAISLYLGSTSEIVSLSKFDRAQELIDSGNYIAFHQFVKELSEQEQIDVFNGAEKGKVTAFKSAWRALLAQAESFFTEIQGAVEEAVTNDDTLMLEQTLSECSSYERKVVWERLGADVQSLVKQMRSAA